MSPSEALCGDITKALPSGATSGGWRYTGLGRAVKLSAIAILPPFTAGSAHVCGPKEAKGEGANPSIARKHTSLPKRKKFLLSFLSCIILLADSPSPQNIFWFGKTLSFPVNVLLFVFLSSTYTSL